MRDLSKTEEMAIIDLQKKCNDDNVSVKRISEMVETMTSLLQKDMIYVIRLESGEYFWRSTDKGNEYVETHK